MRNHAQEYMVSAQYFAPRGKERLMFLGEQISHRHLFFNDRLIGILGDAGAGKSSFIKGMFPGLQLANDDDIVNPRKIMQVRNPLNDIEDATTYHFDVRFQMAFMQMYEIADFVRSLLERKRRVVVEHFNLLYDALVLPNLGLEFYLGRGWSIAGNWMYTWLKSDSRHRYHRIYGGDLEVRRWLSYGRKPLTGHHMGVYGLLLTYDLEWGGKLVFLNSVVGGAIDALFMPAILKGVMDCMERGPLTGSYARDVRVIVYDGKMHPVDSNELSFTLAARHAFSDAFKQAGPKILEPIYDLEVFVPGDYMGDVMSDLQGRRAMIMGMDSEAGYQKLQAKIPLKELANYSISLSSLTGGRASFTTKFASYELVPNELQQELIAKHEAEANDDDE